MLTLATGEQGLDDREPFDLAEVAGDVLRSRRPAGVTVVAALDVAPAIGDPRLVQSMVANLVDNALRYNVPDGQVEVATMTAGGMAQIVVRNSGPVVPPEELGRLFEPFQQLRGERIRHGDGHGLGLAIVRAIANAHGAVVDARARPGGGLYVAVVFPDPADQRPMWTSTVRA